MPVTSACLSAAALAQALPSSQSGVERTHHGMSVTRALKLIEPVRLRAEVVHGFGRGSKQLGFPTANLKIPWDERDEAAPSAEEHAVLNFAKRGDTGIYCGFAYIENGPDKQVHKVAMSMGWNPTFKDVKAKTIEPWILHTFSNDFYGCQLRLLICGYIRPEMQFGSVDDLIKEISADGAFCSAALDSPELANYRSDSFLNVRTAHPKHAKGFPANVRVGGRVQDIIPQLPPPRPRTTRLLLVRHGESEANAAKVLSGSGNVTQLSARGREQADALADQLVMLTCLDITVVGSSSLLRAQDTADIIARRFPRVARMTLEGLNEMSYGSLEGVRIEDVKGQLSDIARRWRQGDVSRRISANGESPQEVLDRTLDVVKSVASTHAGGTVLLVCHSWVVKTFISSALPSIGLSGMLDVPQGNCALNIVDVSIDDADDRSTLSFDVLGVDLVSSMPPSRL